MVGLKYYTIKIDKVIEKEETPIIHTFTLHEKKMKHWKQKDSKNKKVEGVNVNHKILWVSYMALVRQY